MLSSRRRLPDGSYAPISSAELRVEVASRLRTIIEESGPAAVAIYTGTKATGNASAPILCKPFLDAIGSPMLFTADTIDQPGKAVARALHGTWAAGPQAFDRPDVGLILGANPFVSYCGGLPSGNPGRQLQRWLADGFTLIVIDPRRSDVAKRATIHLQPRPGEDVAILAGLVRVILEEDLFDEQFVADDVTGLAQLREAVSGYTPAYVAERADVDGAALVAAARAFATGARGYAVASTGANMSGQGTLVEYLVLTLNTLCGRWRRAGESVGNPLTAYPVGPLRAQAIGPSPAYALGEPMSATGLRPSAAGLPTSALPDQILHDGPDRVRALITCGGNPAAAWPDQAKTIRAMRHLDLLVQIDVRMTATAQLADYVVAPLMGLEMPSVTRTPESMSQYGVAYGGYAAPWGQWTDAVVEPPPGSDLIPEWELFYGLAQELNLALEVPTPHGGTPSVTLDRWRKPTTEELIELACVGSRVSVDELRARPEGGLFPEPGVVVLPKAAGCTTRLDVGNGEMMADLVADLAELPGRDERLATGESLEFRLVSRRVQHVYNSSGHDLEGVRRPSYNPAYMHPSDMERLGAEDGAVVRITSRTASIVALVKPDDGLRRGLVSMTHAFGAGPERDADFRDIGSNTSRLVSTEDDLAPYTGQPRMSNIPVAVALVATSP